MKYYKVVVGFKIRYFRCLLDALIYIGNIEEETYEFIYLFEVEEINNTRTTAIIWYCDRG